MSRLSGGVISQKREGVISQKPSKKITCTSVWGRQVCPFRGAEAILNGFTIGHKVISRDRNT